jgi:Leucine-rich repeat (LRR) protein
VLALDHEPEGAEPHKQINNKLMRFEHRKKLARLVKSNDTQWMLANQGYDEESFRDVPENNKLEWLYLDRGLFKRLDFFRSTSLTNLHIPLCQITDITLNGNYPELTQLDLMKNTVKKFDGLNSCRKLRKLGLDMNEIEVLDLTVLDLPCLE